MFPNITRSFVFDNVLFISAPVCEQETLAKSCDPVSLPDVGSHARSASVLTGKPC